MLRYSKRLKHISPLVFAFERLFALFSMCSLADILFGTREDFEQERTSVEKVKATVRRGRQIEAYIITWLFLEIFCVVFISKFTNCFPDVFRILLGYRIFEIMQAQLNLNIFSSLRTHGRTPRVASLARTVVLSLWNFFELIICFGAIYSSAKCYLKNVVTWYDPYYFSIVTQLTIGYGDVLPLGVLRTIVAIQGLCGFIIAVIVIGRLVSFLPRTKPVLRGR